MYVYQRERDSEKGGEGWGTFEKWYSSGNIILRAKFPSLDETPSRVMVCVSGDARLLRRFKDRDFDTGGWTPFSSKVRSSGSSLFKSRYLITLLFVSAMRNLPAAWQKISSTLQHKLVTNASRKNWSPISCLVINIIYITLHWPCI